MRDRFLTVVVLAIVVAGFAVAAQSAHENAVKGSQDGTDVVNETWQPTAGSVTQLDNSDEDLVFTDQENVTVTQNGTTIQPQGNWTWYESNGTIKTNSSTAMNTSETALINYTYYEPTEQQQLAKDVSLIAGDSIGGTLVQVLGILLLLFAVVVMVGMAQ